MRADDIGPAGAPAELPEEVGTPCGAQRFDQLIELFKRRMPLRSSRESTPALEDAPHPALIVYFRNHIDPQSECVEVGSSASSLVDRFAIEIVRLAARIGQQDLSGVGTRVQIGPGEFVEFVVQATAAGLIVSVVGPTALEGALSDRRRELQRRLSGHGLSLASLRFSTRRSTNRAFKSDQRLTTLLAHSRTP